MVRQREKAQRGAEEERLGRLRKDETNTQEKEREVGRILAVGSRLAVRQGQVLISSRVKVWAQNRKGSSSLEDCFYFNFFKFVIFFFFFFKLCKLH